MKYIKLILIISLFQASVCAAQSGEQVNVEVLKKGLSILNVIKLNNGKEITTKDLIIGPFETQSFEMLSDGEIKKNYPEMAGGVVNIIRLKPNVKLISLNQILDKYKIDPKFRNYKILYEDEEVENPSALLASTDILENVVVNTDKHYINIITKLYQNILKARKQGKLDKLQRIEEYKNSKN